MEKSASTNPNSHLSCPSLNFGLLAHFGLDANLTDLSGHDLNGTAQEISPQTDRYGYSNMSLGFNEENNTIFLPELQVGENGFTVMGWVGNYLGQNLNNGEIFSLGEESKSGFSFQSKSNGSISWGTGHSTYRLMLIHRLILGITLQLPLNQ